MATHALMKDGLGESAVSRINRGLILAGASYDADAFQRDAMIGLENLELKQRVDHLIGVIARYLPSQFEESSVILGRLCEVWDDGDPEDVLRPFAAWPIIDYVSKYGINFPDISLPLLRYLTPLFSAEFAIRPFLIHHQERTYFEMMMWCLDPNEHVRRLASEGIRPRLPWGMQLKQYIKDPLPIIPLLDSLVDDPSDYVRRSVANNLNDISKDHPDLVIETCQRWLSEKIAARKWVISRATRTLVKQGHPKVFSLLGHTRSPKVDVTSFSLTPEQINFDTPLHISLDLRSTTESPQSLVIDYAIHFVKATGKTKAKVFKWKNLKLKPHKQVILEKEHTITPITTRKYYAGIHRVDLLINGKVKASSSFDLSIPSERGA